MRILNNHRRAMRMILCALPLIVATGPAYSQYTSRPLLSLKAPAPPVIDGNLDEPLWKNAPRADVFIDNITSKPANEQTEAMLAYDDQAIYVAFYCHDARPDRIAAREIQYGASFNNDDTVTFSIDPYYSRGYGGASFFTVNPLGTQAESIAGGRAAKREWRGVWQAGAKRVNDGWTCEMRIPWKMLNFPAGGKPVTMGINFRRTQSRTRVTSTWSDLTQYFRAEYIGKWEGVIAPRNAHVKPLQELVYVSPDFAEGAKPSIKAGADIRYRPNPVMTGVMSIAPDFKNIERAVEGIQFSRSERYVGETRPFFVEGRQFFRGLFYSNRIHDFDIGAKAFGKINRDLSFGLLTVERNMNYNATVASMGYSMAQHGQFNLFGTIRRSAEPSHEAFGYNGYLQSGMWSVSSNYARAREGSRSGGDADLGFGYGDKHWGVYFDQTSTDPSYSPSLGFVSFTDIRASSLSTSFSSQYRNGPLRSLYTGISGQYAAHYSGTEFSKSADASIGVTTRSDYSLSLSRHMGQFEHAHDRTNSLGLAGNTNDQYKYWSLGYEWGLLDDHDYQSWSLGIARRLFRRLDLGLTGSILRHEENREQFIGTFGWRFDARRTITGRLVQGDGHTNVYMAFRSAGGLGQDFFLIVGDPNAARFTNRIAIKWVWAN